MHTTAVSTIKECSIHLIQRFIDMMGDHIMLLVDKRIS